MRVLEAARNRNKNTAKKPKPKKNKQITLFSSTLCKKMDIRTTSISGARVCKATSYLVYRNDVILKISICFRLHVTRSNNPDELWTLTLMPPHMPDGNTNNNEDMK